MRLFVRSLLTIALLTGLLLPRLGGLLVEIVPGVTQMVICTGNEMITLVLDSDGVPVEMPDHDGQPCLSSDVPVLQGTPQPAWLEFAAMPALGPANIAAVPRGPRLFAEILPSQAPPELFS